MGWGIALLVLVILVMLGIIVRLRARVRILQKILNEIEGVDEQDEHFDKAGG